jgi:hypothetical protein
MATSSNNQTRRRDASLTDCGRTLIVVVQGPQSVQRDPIRARLSAAYLGARSAQLRAIRGRSGRVPQSIVFHLAVTDRPSAKRQIGQGARHYQQPESVEY